MSICPICGVMTTDQGATAGQGEGPLPDSVKELDHRDYDVRIHVNSDTFGHAISHSYSVQHKHIKCELCTALEQVARRDPERFRKMVVSAALEDTLERYSDAWKSLADA